MPNPVVVERTELLNSGKPDERRIRKHYYWCPGCDSLHGVAINPDKQSNGAGGDFSGALDCPTYSPSQLTTFEQTVDGAPVRHVCHTFIRAGQIEFLTDSTHELAGKTVPLPPLPDWMVRERDDL